MYNNKLFNNFNGVYYNAPFNMEATVPHVKNEHSYPNLNKLNKVNIFVGNNLEKVASIDIDMNDENSLLAASMNTNLQLSKINTGIPIEAYQRVRALPQITEQKVNNSNDLEADSQLLSSQQTTTLPSSNSECQELINKYNREIDNLHDIIQSLKIDFISPTGPQKAKKQIIFEFAEFGKQLARYHAIVESKYCLALVYDTRYEDGIQYLPPDLGEKPIKVILPEENKSFTVYCLGLSFSLGCLDVIILVKNNN